MNKKEKNIPKINRRKFTKKIGLFIGFVALAEFSAVVLSMLRTKPKNNNTADKNLFNAGNVISFKNESVTSFRSRQFYIYRAQNGGFLAITSSCSHLGCAVFWDEEKDQFICPCHSSHFNIKGDVLSAPAPRALDYLPVTIKNGEVYVNLDQKIRRQNFSNKQLVHA